MLQEAWWGGGGGRIWRLCEQIKGEDQGEIPRVNYTRIGKSRFEDTRISSS